MNLSLFFKSWSFILIIIFGVSESVFSQEQQTRTHTVEIKTMKFIPEELIINKGDTVIWINRDFFPHDVTELKNKEWSSSVMQQGKSWTKVITKSTNYYCSLHVVMKGKLIIK